MDGLDRSAGMGFEVDGGRLRDAVERRLSELTPGGPSPPRLAEAMRYSLLAPGKRARAVLTLLSAAHCGGALEGAMNSACALEMIHASSLILDDLPAMDDATLRRGRAACHKVYGEATAVLAAIALMNRAYAVVAEDERLAPDCKVGIMRMLAVAIGTDGLAGGQECDLHGGDCDGVAGVEWIHARKTAALFAAAAQIGAVISGAAERVAPMRHFGRQIGLAFQTFDDLLDARGVPALAGKDTGRDGGKPTLVSLLGWEAAFAHAESQMRDALASIPGEPGELGRYVASLVAQLRLPMAAAP